MKHDGAAVKRRQKKRSWWWHLHVSSIAIFSIYREPRRCMPDAIQSRGKISNHKNEIIKNHKLPFQRLCKFLAGFFLRSYKKLFFILVLKVNNINIHNTDIKVLAEEIFLRGCGINSSSSRASRESVSDLEPSRKASKTFWREDRCAKGKREAICASCMNYDLEQLQVFYDWL